MANFRYAREFLMIMQCNGLLERRDPDPFAPLASYHEAGLPFSDLSQNWIIALLRPGKSQRYYLTVKNRAGRPRDDKSERNDLIVKRFAELDNETITDALCLKLPATTGMSIVEPDAAAPGTRQFGWQEQDDCGDWIPVHLTLKLGSALNLLQAQKIIAAEFRVSVSTVKRVLPGNSALTIVADLNLLFDPTFQQFVDDHRLLCAGGGGSIN
jgi:hypothetical protein